VHEETFLTQEALQKAVEAMKLASEAPYPIFYGVGLKDLP